MIYSYFELFGGIILIILSIILIIFIIKDYTEGDSLFLIFPGVMIFFGVFAFYDSFCPPTPTKEDVLDKKAEYIETIHITGNDTIKTYNIKWKEEFNK